MASEHDEIRTDVCHVRNTLTLPTQTIDDSHFSSATADRLTAGKVVHRQVITYEEPITTSTATTSKQYMTHGAGSIAGIEYSVATASTGTDTVTIDLQKASDGSGTYATVLTGTITINSGTTADTRATGSVSTTAFSAYDRFDLQITATGTSTKGLVCNVLLNEEPA